MATDSSTMSRTRTSGRPPVGWQLAACAASLLALAGCAGLAANKKEPGLMYQEVSAFSHPLFADTARAVANSRAPMDVTFDPLLEAASDFRLKLDLRIADSELHDTEMVWAMSTILMFGAYPASCARREAVLTADLYGRDGTRMGSWSIVENDTSFMWLFQGSDCGGSLTAKSFNRLASAMLKNLYSQIRRDVLLKPVGAPLPAAPALVYVNAVNADELVQRFILQARPLTKLSFDPADAASAEKTLTTEFSFQSPEQSLGGILGRTMSTFMTLGLVSGCAPNTISLDAEIRDANDAVVRTYRLSKKVRGSMSNNCALPDEYSKPGKLRALLKELLQQMEDDGTL